MVTITPLNGRMPLVMLAPTATGQLLRIDARDSLDRLSDAMDRAGHGPLLLSAGMSGYRSLADQQVMIDKGLTTMRPGRSQHGEAVAGDFRNLGGFTGRRYLWLLANGPAYGWSQPTWARRFGVLPEYWHWEYNPATDLHRPVPVSNPTKVPTVPGAPDLTLPDELEADMTPEQEKRLHDRLDQIVDHFHDRIADVVAYFDRRMTADRDALAGWTREDARNALGAIAEVPEAVWAFPNPTGGRPDVPMRDEVSHTKTKVTRIEERLTTPPPDDAA